MFDTEYYQSQRQPYRKRGFPYDLLIICLVAFTAFTLAMDVIMDIPPSWVESHK